MPRWVALWLSAVEAFLAGHLDESERLADEAAQVGSDGGQPDALTFYTGQLEQVRWAQDRLDEVEGLLEQGVEDNPDLSPYRALLAVTYASTGKLDEARALLEPVAAGGFEDVAREMLWLTAMVRWAEVAAEVGDTAAAGTLYELLRPWADQFPSMSITTWMPVAHYLGLLAGIRGDTQSAEAHFARAVELEEGLEAHLFSACSRLEWGRTLLASGPDADAARGRALVAEAVETARELGGIPRVERRAQEVLASRAASVPP